MSDNILDLALEGDRLQREFADLEQLLNGIEALQQIMAKYPSSTAAEREDLLVELGKAETEFAVAMRTTDAPFNPSWPWSDGRVGCPRLGVSVTTDWKRLKLAPDWSYQVNCLTTWIKRQKELLRQRSETVKRLLAARREAHLSKKKPKDPTLGPKEYDVLITLNKSHPVRLLLVDLGVKAGISARTCGPLVKKLIKAGLALRDGKRGGVGITDAGRNLVPTPVA